ncbi:hypothetical protein J3F83DRAFT_741219 [Trichoderma novae-zelandiae]
MRTGWMEGWTLDVNATPGAGYRRGTRASRHFSRTHAQGGESQPSHDGRTIWANWLKLKTARRDTARIRPHQANHQAWQGLGSLDESRCCWEQLHGRPLTGTK